MLSEIDHPKTLKAFSQTLLKRRHLCLTKMRKKTEVAGIGGSFWNFW
jgi:hypothetical protein